MVRNVEVSNLRSGESTRALYLIGYADAPIRDVRLENCVFESASEPNIVENVEGLQLNNVSINGTRYGRR